MNEHQESPPTYRHPADGISVTGISLEASKKHGDHDQRLHKQIVHLKPGLVDPAGNVSRISYIRKPAEEVAQHIERSDKHSTRYNDCPHLGRTQEESYNQPPDT